MGKGREIGCWAASIAGCGGKLRSQEHAISRGMFDGLVTVMGGPWARGGTVSLPIKAIKARIRASLDFAVEHALDRADVGEPAETRAARLDELAEELIRGALAGVGIRAEKDLFRERRASSNWHRRVLPDSASPHEPSPQAPRRRLPAPGCAARRLSGERYSFEERYA